jgi:hypothetical protein
MDEILYQVCRDSKEYAEDSGDVVTIWSGETPLELGTWVCDPELKYWEPKTGFGQGEDPLFEFSPEEFKDNFYMDPPEYGEKFFIRTYCKWEKVEFIKGIPDE